MDAMISSFDYRMYQSTEEEAGQLTVDIFKTFIIYHSSVYWSISFYTFAVLYFWFFLLLSLYFTLLPPIRYRIGGKRGAPRNCHFQQFWVDTRWKKNTTVITVSKVGMENWNWNAYQDEKRCSVAMPVCCWKLRSILFFRSHLFANGNNLQYSHSGLCGDWTKFIASLKKLRNGNAKSK